MFESADQTLDIARRCMLRAPVTGMLDEIVVMDPVKRCITVASAITQTISSESQYARVLDAVGGKGVNDGLAQDAREISVFDLLKAEAIARHSGKRSPMPPLIMPTSNDQRRSTQRV